MEHAVSLEMMLGRLRERQGELSAFRDRRVAPITNLEISLDERKTWHPIDRGDAWPERVADAALRCSMPVPDGFAEQPVHARLDVGGETLVIIDGKSAGAINPYHREIRLTARAADRIAFELQVVPYGLFGTPIHRPAIRDATLIVPDDDVRALAFDLEVILDAAEHLAQLAGREALAFELLDAASDVFGQVALPRHDTEAYLARLAHGARHVDLRDPGGTQAGHLAKGLWERHTYGTLAELDPTTREQLQAARKTLASLVSEIASHAPPEGRLLASGHAHIDLAWLWPFSETRKKLRRTFSTVLDLMERYPELTFNQSSAQMYAWVEEDDPELFARIKQRVEEGRWEIVGGMWVEADGNLPAGEAWVRQLLYGQRWFEQKLGRRATVAWFPDTFGYAGNLPQLLVEAGLSSFFTIKLNWSETNTFPFDLYRWQGIDGSEVVAHMLKNHNGYNGVLGPARTLETWKNFRGKRHHGRSLFTFGWGDGGGGPTYEMLERGARQTELPGLPRVEHGRVESLFADVDSSTLPVWVGEQYLEYHRGTYTSQAALKQLDRRVTHGLVEAEAAAALAWVLIPKTDYPGNNLAEAWKTLLRNQFHDVLPGSCIETVARESKAELRGALATAAQIRAASLEQLGAEVGSGGPSVVVFNLSLADRPLIGRLPRPQEGPFRLIGPDGKEVDQQVLEEGDGEIFVSSPLDVPGLGYLTLRVEDASPVPKKPKVVVSETLLENGDLRVKIGDDGTLSSIVCKRFERELLSDRGNQIWAYTDVPREYDAWDIDSSYAAEGREVTASTPPEVLASGPILGIVRVVRRLGDASITQTYRLAAGAVRLDVHTEIQWTGRRTMLRALFPLAIRSHEAWFETAFGAVARPTHRNTPWDAAKFEVPAHRFADMSEGNFGVSILNDGKYGHSAASNVLGLTLLRSPIYPDPRADEGRHSFTYSVHPHAGDWRTTTVRQAHDLNAPLIGVCAPGTGSWQPVRRLLSLSGDALELSALKKSEDDDALVLRVYESAGSRGVAGLSSELSITRWNTCSVLEEPRRSLGPAARIEYQPFKVVTVRGSR